MTDYNQVIRALTNDLDEAREELKKKEKQIQTLKKTNKIAQSHSETLRKKLLTLQKKSTVLVEEDPSKQPSKQNRSQSLNQQIDRLKTALANVQEENKHLNEIISDQKNKIKQYEQELSKKSSGNLQLQKLKNQRLKQSKQNEKKAAEYDKKIINLENELTKAKRTISELSIQKKSAIRQPSSVKSQQYYQQSIGSTNRVGFFEPVHLTQSLNENHIEIPTSHKKLFKLLDIYYDRLMPNERVGFLNLISANAENKLEMINNDMEVLGDMDDDE